MESKVIREMGFERNGKEGEKQTRQTEGAKQLKLQRNKTQ